MVCWGLCWIQRLVCICELLSVRLCGVGPFKYTHVCIRISLMPDPTLYTKLLNAHYSNRIEVPIHICQQMKTINVYYMQFGNLFWQNVCENIYVFLPIVKVLEVLCESLVNISYIYICGWVYHLSVYVCCVPQRVAEYRT